MKGLFSLFSGRGSEKKLKHFLVADTKIKMGTFVNIQCLYTDEQKAHKLLEQSFSLIDVLEQIFSRHDSASLLSTLNNQGKIKDFPKEFLFVVEQANIVEQKTFGAFNASVLPVLSYLETHKNISHKELEDCFKMVKANAVKTSSHEISLIQSDTKITLDAIAKGFIVDSVAELLEKNGIIHYLINAGGDIRVRGMKSLEEGNTKAWKIAIEDPYKQQKYPAVFSLMRGALATSGNYEKNFGNTAHHIIMPYLNQSSYEKSLLSYSSLDENISPTVKSVSVIAETTMIADAYATAISCMQIEHALQYVKQNNLSCMIIDADDKIHTSENWLVR